MASKFTKALGAAVLVVLLALPARSQAASVTDTEPNNNVAEAQAVFPGDVITGELLFDINGDQFDVFLYSGLQAGSSFDVFVEYLDSDAPTSALDTMVSALDPQQFFVLKRIGVEGGTAHITGVVPADGNLVVTATGGFFGPGPELLNYRFSLTTSTEVPVPASLALVAAGLVGLGSLHVARSKEGRLQGARRAPGGAREGGARRAT